MSRREWLKISIPYDHDAVSEGEFDTIFTIPNGEDLR